MVQPCYNSVRDMGMSSWRLAEFYRTQLVAPLKTMLSLNRSAIDTHGQRYVAARTQCLETRNRALNARAKYVKAIRVAENAFRKWKSARKSRQLNGEENEDTPVFSAASDGPPWEKVLREYGKHIPAETDHLVRRLHNVEETKVRYQQLVDNENDAVAYAVRIEAVALDAIQEVETKRVRFFLESVVQQLCSVDDEKLEKLPMTPQSIDMKPNSEETTSLDLKKGKDLLANIFIRQSIVYDESIGRMDAETLGVPLACGDLRNDVKKQVSGLAARIKAAEILTEFLDTIGSGILALEGGLKIDSVPAKAQEQTLGQLASSSAGPAAAEMWKTVVKIHEDEAVVAGEIASTVAKLRLQKLEVFLETAQKDLKAEKDFDDANWKTLCEIARTETKAAARYRQVRAQQEKARERVLSVDAAKGEEGMEENGSQQSTPQKNRMSKALFAGGEVMKKFQENARMALAKSTLNEAEQNAAKEQQALDEATAAKSQAIADYQRVTESRVKKLEAINQTVRKDFEKVMESIMKGLARLRKARLDGLQAPLDGIKAIHDTLIKDIDEWVQSAKDRIEANRRIAVIDESEQRDNNFGEGFQLAVSLLESENISNILTLNDPTSPPPDFISKSDGTLSAESSDDEIGINAADSFESNVSTHSAKALSADLSLAPDDRPSDSGSISMPVTPIKLSNEANAIQHADSNFEETADINGKKQQSHDLIVFMRHFWDNQDDSENAPEILEIIACAYRPKEKAGFLIPTLHGRLYTTTEKLYFLAWDGKNFVLPCDKIVNMTKEKGFMGAGDNAIVVTYKTSNDSEATFILSRVASRDKVLEHLRTLLPNPKARTLPAQVKSDSTSLPPVPEDELLKKMTIVLSRPLRGVSVQQVYEKAWSEGIGTAEKPFYEPWLIEEECFEIKVEDWEFAESGSEGFIGPWDEERYTMRRLCTFKFKRTSHLYIGPPIAFVKQMHHCRIEGNDKCVVCISATMDGIPYSDTFAVEMRWVARRQGLNDLDIKVGLEVHFKKSTMLKSQIKSGTVAETKNVHIRMFNMIKRICQTASDSADVTVDGSMSDVEQQQQEEEAIERPGLFSRVGSGFLAIPINGNFLLFATVTLAYPLVFNFFSALLGAPAISMSEAQRLSLQIQELRVEVRDLKATLDDAIKLLKRNES